MGMIARQLEDDAVLGEVGVLVLVHEDVLEVCSILLQHVRMVSEEQEGVEQEVVEVHGVGLPASLPIVAVDVAQGRDAGGLVSLQGFAVIGVRGRCDQVVLGVGDAPLHQTGFVGLFVQLHFLDDGAEEAARVVRVVDGEVGSES